jgi:hypothetical protein
VTEKTVYNAIRFDDRRGNSELSAKIRKLAMDRGGIVMVVIPEVEVFHDYDKVSRLYCPNGALIEFDRKDGSGQVIFKGETVKTYEHVMVSEIDHIKAFASALR